MIRSLHLAHTFLTTLPFPHVGEVKDGARFVIAAPDAQKPPFIASGIPQFVSTRGGDYFFTPSMTALRMIGQGVVDPT